MEDRGGNGNVTRASEACRQFDSDLEAYLEGEARPGVDAHAVECAFCAALLADLQLVRAAAGGLEPDEPPARLWANVRAALVDEGLIRSPRQRGWWQWALRPVPVTALAGLLLAGFLYYMGSGGSLRHDAHVAQGAVALVDPNLAQSMDKMEQAFRVRAVGLDPRVKVAYEKGLDSLDAEIQECNAFLSQQPDDLLAREYLASAYTEKARVLASALELGDGNVQ
ncbi:MAG TPA: hypothetical protein VL523_19595 [Terriglobia bacterium]|nr:hypothetical protein [Terriglobia bacterium]